MNAIAIPDGVGELLDGPNYAHLTTLMPDGSPRNHVVWVWREDDHIIIATSAGNAKGQDMELDPRVSLSVVDYQDPYRMASIRGEVVEVRPDDAFTLMDQIARKYTSGPFPTHDFELAYYVIAVTSAYQRHLGGFTHNPGAAWAD